MGAYRLLGTKKCPKADSFENWKMVIGIYMRNMSPIASITENLLHQLKDVDGLKYYCCIYLNIAINGFGY